MTRGRARLPLRQLRTPLTALRLRLENMARNGAPEREPELEGALEEVERLSALVDGLLTLARVDRAASAPVDLDIADAILERVEAWTALAAEQDVQLERVPARVAASKPSFASAPGSTPAKGAAAPS